MGTITVRKNKDGTVYTAQIRIMDRGRTVHSESKTFARRQAAGLWLKKREAQLADPGAWKAAMPATLAEAIERYVAEKLTEIGRTKTQVLRTIAADEIGQLQCKDVRSQEIVAFAKRLDVQPQTRKNYLSHLAAVFRVAGPAWGFELDVGQMAAARVVLEHLGLTGKSKQRDRRPTLDELSRLMRYFSGQSVRKKARLPMGELVLFALFSTRRQEEITRLRWADFEPVQRRIWVRDMKHPGEKKGNDQLVALPDPALAVIEGQPRRGDLIFPFNSKSVSAAFTRACTVLGIEDLHFHDLRHEGISRLFELGWTIPQVATVSGHRTWVSLKRYTHIREMGDKYKGWEFLPVRIC